MGARLRFKVLSVVGLLAAGATGLAVACGGDDGGVDPACEGPTCDGGALSETSTTDSPSEVDSSTPPGDGGSDADADSSVVMNCGEGGAPGTLDPSFGNGGIVVLPLLDADATGVVIQPDGKIIVVGQSQTADGDGLTIVRLMPNGALDSSFGTGGVVARNVTGNTPQLLKAVALQADGKIVAAGAARPTGDDFVVVRYLANGMPDTAFGDAGLVMTNFSSLEQANALAVMADGRIILAGFTAAGDGDLALARYNVDGSPDTTFGGTGKVTLNVRGTADQARGLALVASGKIVVAGMSRDPNASRSDVVAMRLGADGTIDSTFGDGGAFLTTFGGAGNDTANGVAIDPLGNIVLAGVRDGIDFGVLRLAPGGTPDPSFGAGGSARTDFSARADNAQAVSIQEDGKIVVVGSSLSAVPTDARVGIARYLADGGLDPAFGASGQALAPLPTGFSGSGSARAMALGSCRIVVAGGWSDPTPTQRMGLMVFRR